MEKRLTDQQIKELQDKFLGKKISVPSNKYTGFGMRSDFTVGKCKFIGYNPHLPSWGLQVTLDRTPIRNVDHIKIKLYE